VKKKKTFKQRFREDIWYIIFLLPIIVLLFFFVYRPMYGLVIVFQNYRIGSPILSFDGSIEWVGFRHFTSFMQSIFFRRVAGNTVRLSLLTLFFASWVSLAAAILLNELRVFWFKRTMQTIYYLPYFVSTVVVISIMNMMMGITGPFSRLSEFFGGTARNFMNDPAYFDMLYVGSGIWQTFGYGSIVYLAAIAGVDPGLYEAVIVDGGNRWHRIRHATLPYILPTWIILMILTIGGLFHADVLRVLLMYNAHTMERADIIGTYVYRLGLLHAEYSYTAAVGLFVNIITFGLVFGVNMASRKLTGHSLW